MSKPNYSLEKQTTDNEDQPHPPDFQHVQELMRETSNVLSQLDGWTKISLRTTAGITNSSGDNPASVNISNVSYTHLKLNSPEAQTVLKNIHVIGKALDGVSVKLISDGSQFNSIIGGCLAAAAESQNPTCIPGCSLLTSSRCGGSISSFASSVNDQTPTDCSIGEKVPVETSEHNLMSDCLQTESSFSCLSTGTALASVVAVSDTGANMVPTEVVNQETPSSVSLGYKRTATKRSWHRPMLAVCTHSTASMSEKPTVNVDKCPSTSEGPMLHIPDPKSAASSCALDGAQMLKNISSCTERLHHRKRPLFVVRSKKHITLSTTK